MIQPLSGRPPVKQRAHRLHGKRSLADIAFLTLHLIGFAASVLLMSWGLFVLFFFVIGGLSLDGLMHQLANFTSRYVAADGRRVAHFQMVLIGTHILLSLAIIFFRRPRLLAGGTANRRQVHDAAA